MAIVMAERRIVQRPGPRDPRQVRRLEIQGRAMGVVAETGWGRQHIEAAAAIDKRGDAVRARLRRLVDQSRGDLIEGDRDRALGKLQAAGVYLDQIEALDAAEEQHWREEAPAHVAEAQSEGRAIVRLSDEQGEGLT